MLTQFSQYFAGFTTGAIALRLIFATVLGGIIGLERATKHHPAGMRTFALVCPGPTGMPCAFDHCIKSETMRK